MGRLSSEDLKSKGEIALLKRDGRLVCNPCQVLLSRTRENPERSQDDLCDRRTGSRSFNQDRSGTLGPFSLFGSLYRKGDSISRSLSYDVPSCQSAGIQSSRNTSPAKLCSRESRLCSECSTGSCLVLTLMDFKIVQFSALGVQYADLMAVGNRSATEPDGVSSTRRKS